MAGKTTTRTIQLTEQQATILLTVAGNGCGDGDFFGANNDEPFTDGWRNRRDAATYNRAIAAICEPFGWDGSLYMCPLD